MVFWWHCISDIKKCSGNYAVYGYTVDEKTNNTIEWRLEIDSNCALVHPDPPSFAKFYTHTKLEDCMKRRWNEEAQFIFTFIKEDINFMYAIHDNGCIEEVY